MMILKLIFQECERIAAIYFDFSDPQTCGRCGAEIYWPIKSNRSAEISIASDVQIALVIDRRIRAYVQSILVCYI